MDTINGRVYRSLSAKVEKDLGFHQWVCLLRSLCNKVEEVEEVEEVEGKVVEAIAAGAAEEIEAIAPEPPPLDEEPVDSAPAEPTDITFSSLEADTKKVIVRCDEETSRGAERATIAMASANSCTVTAIRSDRSRLTAVVPGATAGSYTCFVGGESKCERE